MLQKIYVTRKYSQNRYVKVLLKILDSQAVTGVRGSVAWVNGNAYRVIGGVFVTGNTATDSVVIHMTSVERLAGWARFQQRSTLLGGFFEGHNGQPGGGVINEDS